ncbi:MAG: hypothetical protein ACREHV_11800 [Rhizomicrobium sp.]
MFIEEPDPQRAVSKDDTGTLLMIGGGVLAAFLLYEWYSNRAAASTPACTTAPACSASSSSCTASTGASCGETCGGECETGDGGNYFYSDPIPVLPPAPVASRTQAAPHPMAFGVWYAHCSPTEKAWLAKLTVAQRHAAYEQGYVEKWREGQFGGP